MNKAELREAVRALIEKRRGKPDIDWMKVTELKALLKVEREFWTCKNCGEELVILEWGSRSDMLICENIACRRYHTPAGAIPSLKPAIILEPQPAKKKKRHYRRKDI